MLRMPSERSFSVRCGASPEIYKGVSANEKEAEPTTTPVKATKPTSQVKLPGDNVNTLVSPNGKERNISLVPKPDKKTKKKDCC